MADVNQGHVTQVEYTHGYYGELSPVRAQFAFAYAGLRAPIFTTACELGFGQGISIALHEAAQPIEWWGTDFNPQHAAAARSLSSAPRADTRLDEAGFAEFCTRPDLPDFDFIGLHGVWTWISVENQDILIDFIRRKLKPGGVAYISYNTYPGWADVAPLRHLLKTHVDSMGAPAAPLFKRIDAGLGFLGQVNGAGSAYFRAAPRAPDRLASLQALSKNYLAHEYLTDHWNITYFSDFARRMADAKLSFGCSAHVLDHVDAINLTSDQQALLNGLEDPVFREAVRDYCVNQQFRRDLWVKGAEKLNDSERLAAIRSQRVVLTTPVQDVGMKVMGALGEASLHPDVYQPILEILSQGEPKTIGEIEVQCQKLGVEPLKTISAMPILVGMGAVQIAQSDEVIGIKADECRKLNQTIIDRADTRPDIVFLASPTTGGGVPVNRFEQLFLAAYLADAKTPAEWAEQAWSRLSALGQSLVKDGSPLADPADNLAELTRQAQEFAIKKLPILRAVSIA